MASTIRTERRELLAFLKALTPSIAAAHPPEVRGAWLKIDWDTAPIAGLRMSTNDYVEMLTGVEGNELASLDSALEGLNAPTLTNMRDKNFRRFLFLISQREIRKEEDIFLVKGVLDSMPEKLTGAQTAAAMKLLTLNQDDA